VFGQKIGDMITCPLKDFAKMRLPQQALETINHTAHEVFGQNIEVKVFGSRLDDLATGGDIDLLIQSKQKIDQSRRKSLRLVAKLQIRLGDQPIDVIVIDPKTELQAVHREVLRTAVAI